MRLWLPALLVATLAPLPSAAADLQSFDAACHGPKAPVFLLKDAPAGTDADKALTALCPCLEATFAAYTQPEIDALTADLRTGTSDEGKAIYRGYSDLQAKASDVLAACFASPAMQAALPKAR